ncbi:DUF3727 domain-containing protein [Candidatus Gracilibacteria bacterium]|jgi:Protein of unknown function (DUF3727)/Protein of unknown function (DUF1292)|nr:DUF3727 domain-containing protein [Candidatus Gracilibacteria bacterium]NJM87533.1 DUF3727 domain-containing protein [Hydrococcus sp. RU_2_2]NJP18498.1 DUF3727 domain-containing protein [Hydrococcus sp. CRU_1_1]NJQ97343.1 DUF3727 domain-containing protein [Hydrococcus sp. CSU_1_8]
MSSFRFNPENELDDEEKVTLTDEEERTLECYVENSLETEETTYLLLMPVDTPVVILAWEGEDEDDFSDAIIIEDSEELEQIFADAKAVLAELDLVLKNTAYTLTVSGELPPLEDDDVITLEIDAEEKPLEPEELQFLASFYTQEAKYSIYTPLSPLLFLAKSGERGEIELVSPDDKQMQPILEELLFEELEE